MAEMEEPQELLCSTCGKPVAKFGRTGVWLYCRHSKRETFIPYAAAAGYQQMLEFARQQRPPGRRGSRPAK